MTFSICILTGGKSSRMGTDKSQLYCKGETLENRLIRIAQPFSEDIFIAGKCPHQTSGRHFTDKQNDKGPLSGIQTALTHCKYDWVLILACDMPLIDSALLNWLADALISLKTEKVAFASSDKEHYLVGFYHKSLLEKVNIQIHTDELSVRQLLRAVDVKKLAVPDGLAQSLKNFNSPKDLDTFGFMKVKIIAFGQIEEILGKKELEWMTESSDLKEFKDELFEAFPELNTVSFRFALNESLVDNAKLSMNDTIALLPPFAGG